MLKVTLSPILKLSSQGSPFSNNYSPQFKRMMNSGGSSNNNQVKRSEDLIGCNL